MEKDRCEANKWFYFLWLWILPPFLSCHRRVPTAEPNPSSYTDDLWAAGQHLSVCCFHSLGTPNAASSSQVSWQRLRQPERCCWAVFCSASVSRALRLRLVGAAASRGLAGQSECGGIVPLADEPWWPLVPTGLLPCCSQLLWPLWLKEACVLAAEHRLVQLLLPEGPGRVALLSLIASSSMSRAWRSVPPCCEVLLLLFLAPRLLLQEEDGACGGTAEEGARSSTRSEHLYVAEIGAVLTAYTTVDDDSIETVEHGLSLSLRHGGTKVQVLRVLHHLMLSIDAAPGTPSALARRPTETMARTAGAMQSSGSEEPEDLLDHSGCLEGRVQTTASTHTGCVHGVEKAAKKLVGILLTAIMEVLSSATKGAATVPQLDSFHGGKQHFTPP